jgi:hypothetical protein
MFRPLPTLSAIATMAPADGVGKGGGNVVPKPHCHPPYEPAALTKSMNARSGAGTRRRPG